MSTSKEKLSKEHKWKDFYSRQLSRNNATKTMYAFLAIVTAVLFIKFSWDTYPKFSEGFTTSVLVEDTSVAFFKNAHMRILSENQLQGASYISFEDAIDLGHQNNIENSFVSINKDISGYYRFGVRKDFTVLYFLGEELFPYRFTLYLEFPQEDLVESPLWIRYKLDKYSYDIETKLLSMEYVKSFADGTWLFALFFINLFCGALIFFSYPYIWKKFFKYMHKRQMKKIEATEAHEFLIQGPS